MNFHSRIPVTYSNYRVLTTIRTWLRDGSHPDPGRLLHADTSLHIRRLRDNEVKAYGISAAVFLERRRKERKVVSR